MEAAAGGMLKNIKRTSFPTRPRTCSPFLYRIRKAIERMFCRSSILASGTNAGDGRL